MSLLFEQPETICARAFQSKAEEAFEFMVERGKAGVVADMHFNNRPGVCAVETLRSRGAEGRHGERCGQEDRGDSRHRSNRISSGSIGKPAEPRPASLTPRLLHFVSPSLILLPVLLRQRQSAMSVQKTTRISTKGQVVLPKALRERRGWNVGAEFIVEERPEGVLLRATVKEAPSRMEDVFGSLGPFDRVVSIEEMKQAVVDEAARRWRRKMNVRD